MFVMSFTSVVVDRASFKKTSEMAKVKSFDCQLQISNSTTFLEMSVKFYVVLSLSLCMVLILYLFPGPLPDQSLKKSSNFYSKDINTLNYCSPVARMADYIFFTAQTVMPTGVLLFNI